MNFLISLLLTSRILTLFTGTVTDKSSAYFSPPEIVLTARDVRMNCAINNAYPDELKKLAETGTPIYLYVFAELKWNGDVSVSKTFVESRLYYDLGAKRYLVTKSGIADTSLSSGLDSAITAAAVFKGIPLFQLSAIQQNEVYQIEIYAVLGKTRVEALENKEIDLMYYWNYKRPVIRTEKLSGKQFFMNEK